MLIDCIHRKKGMSFRRLPKRFRRLPKSEKRNFEVRYGGSDSCQGDSG